MRRFTELFIELDGTTKTNEKIAALERYFAAAPDADKLHALALLLERRPKRQVNTRLLREWAALHAHLPQWLFEEGYHQVGDLAEAIALMLPPPQAVADHSLSYRVDYLRQFNRYDEAQKHDYLLAAWDQLGQAERLVFTKLITGGFRLGVSRNLVVRALARLYEVAPAVLEHRLMGNWTPDSTEFSSLVGGDDLLGDSSRPYPFFLAYQLDTAPAELGEPSDWLAEWKWDGIRSQVIVRSGHLFIWTRGEELVTDKYPELHVLRELLPEGTVLDGELLPYRDGRPLTFAVLQTRIGRKTVTPKLLRDAPVALFAYDLLERDGIDLRDRPLAMRREALAEIAEYANSKELLLVSPPVPFADWEELERQREHARETGAEGIMLKRLQSAYRAGRRRGDWWKWKVDPLTVDAVLVYAQKGHGKRSELFTDYTFAVWDGEALVPFAKAYSGLTDRDIREVDAFIRSNTIEKFGPVRTVKPALVFEIAFEGIQRSTRHKSGVAVRFPRILRRRTDKAIADADTLERVQALLALYSG